MRKEIQQEYSTRIVQADRTELLVLVYEMFQQELKEAIEYEEKQEWKDFDGALKQAGRLLTELMGTLDFQYELSFRLLSIYRFIGRQLSSCRAARRTEGLEASIDLIEQLRLAYCQVAKEQKQAPMMKNVEKVYAGLTYGKHALSEITLDESGKTRGLLA